MHKSLSSVFMVLVLALAHAPAARAESGDLAMASVSLQREAVIHDPVVRLGDLFAGIAEPTVAETPIAQAPRLGESVDIGARWLLAVAKAHAIDWQPRSRYDRITVRRASSRIDTAEIETALRLALAERGLDGQLTLALDNPGLEMQVPSSAEHSLAVSGMTLDTKSGRFIAHVTAPARGEPLARLSVTGRALMMTDVPVLRRNLKPGEVIRSSDIDWVSLPIKRLSRGSVVDQQNLIGMSPRRPIRSGQVIRTSDIETPVVVTKNSLVTIRLETERMVLTVKGRALEDGAEGDVVRVMNTKSNSVVNALVVDSGRVVVTPTATAGGN